MNTTEIFGQTPTVLSHPDDTPVGPIHPGEFLRTELMEPLGISQHALARETGLPVSRINQIVLGRRPISAETDLLLTRFFGLSPGYLLRWQGHYDVQVARVALGDRLAAVHPLARVGARLGAAR